jgi:prolyl 4-hydroxylase
MVRVQTTTGSVLTFLLTIVSLILVVFATTTKTNNNSTCVMMEEGDTTTCREHQDELIVAVESSYDEDVDRRDGSEAGVSATAAVPKADYGAGGAGELFGGAEFGKVQTMDMSKFEDQLQSMYTYMTETVMVDEKYRNVKDTCKNQHERCAYWAMLGECNKNPAYMSVNCAPVCQTCELLHVETRCPLDPNANAMNAFAKPGDVNQLFTRIISDPFYLQFGLQVLSRPDLAPGDTKEKADYKVGGPWVLLFENAITSEEADRLIELGGKLGYEPSSEVGALQADGTYGNSVNKVSRTSTTAWCLHECAEDPLAQSAMNRIVNITGIPDANTEILQLLRYEKDQFYKVHNDYLAFQTGQAILWPSVLDQDPSTMDQRTDHTALPVIKGVKYGVNAWLHQRDFKTPYKS